MSNVPNKEQRAKSKEQSVEIPGSLTFDPFATVILSEAKNRVPSMFNSLEVKVLTQPDGGEG